MNWKHIGIIAAVMGACLLVAILLTDVSVDTGPWEEMTQYERCSLFMLLLIWINTLGSSK